jgi:hypothetical protein
MERREALEHWNRLRLSGANRWNSRRVKTLWLQP